MATGLDQLDCSPVLLQFMFIFRMFSPSNRIQEHDTNLCSWFRPRLHVVEPPRWRSIFWQIGVNRIHARYRMQAELSSSSNWLPERREVVPSDTIEGCSSSYPRWKTETTHATSPSGDQSHDGGVRRPRQQDPTSPRLSTMNEEITKATSDIKRRQWQEFVESIDHRTDSTKLWWTIKGIDCREWGHHLHTPHLIQYDTQQF